MQTTNRLGEFVQTTPDLLNRPSLVNYSKDGTSESFGYDAVSNMTRTANNSIGYTFGYEKLNRLTSRSDSRGRSNGFTWDAACRMLTKTTFQGSTTTFTYGGAGTLVSASNPDYLTVNYQYDNAGRILSRVMSSGNRSVSSYDSGGWLTGMSHQDAAESVVNSLCKYPFVVSPNYDQSDSLFGFIECDD